MKQPITYEKVRKIPLIGVVILIANSYAYSGQSAAFKNLAPIGEWFRRIFRNLFITIVIGLVFTLIAYTEISRDGGFKPEEAILDIFPDILGFGIGVFALLFTLPNPFLKRLQSRRKKNSSNTSFGADMLPADMAYPLMVYCIIMLIAALFRLIPDNFITTWVSVTALFYGFLMSFELLGSIFGTATLMVGVKKLETLEENQSQDKDGDAD